MTKAEAIRTQVRDLDAQGQDTDEIAAALGIPATRVEAILDALDTEQGVPHPSWEPVVEPLTREPKAPRVTVAKPKPVPPKPPKRNGPLPKPINHGTNGGYLAHLRRGQEACDDCRTAHTASRAARKRAQAESKQIGPIGRPRQPIKHGTYGGYRQHLRRGEKPCEDCRRGANKARAEQLQRAVNQFHREMPMNGP